MSHESTQKVHADVLKMAKTEEKRDRIKWFEARRLFFGCGRFADGLQVARQSKHEDARLLVSLFPDRVSASTDCRDVAAMVLASPSGKDPRCLCWGAMLGADSRTELIREAALVGYAWAQYAYARTLSEHEHLRWLEKAAAQGDMNALPILANQLWYGKGGVIVVQPRARQLWREATELGNI